MFLARLESQVTGTAFFRSGFLGYGFAALTIPWIEGWRGVNIGVWSGHVVWAVFPGFMVFLLSGAVWQLWGDRFDVRAYALTAPAAGMANELLVQLVAGVTRLDAPPLGRFFVYGLASVLLYWIVFETNLLIVRVHRRFHRD